MTWHLPPALRAVARRVDSREPRGHHDTQERQVRGPQRAERNHGREQWGNEGHGHGDWDDDDKAQTTDPLSGPQVIFFHRFFVLTNCFQA
jgi:hypothetical protein